MQLLSVIALAVVAASSGNDTTTLVQNTITTVVSIILAVVALYAYVVGARDGRYDCGICSDRARRRAHAVLLHTTHSVYREDRGALLVFFIGEIWTLAAVTAYLQSVRCRA